MLCLLVIAILGMAKSERQSNTAFAEGVETRVLADLPLNLVLAQLRQATEMNGTTRTWASQPGMIRVYGQVPGPIAGRTRLERAYKLYSAAQMEAAPASDGLAPQMTPDAELPQAWLAQPATFTDLNEPVATDPDRDGTPELEYPILDPTAFTPGAGGSSIAGAELTDGAGWERRPDGDAAHPLPMPVRWLYLLQDGSLHAGMPEGWTKMRIPAASLANPIIGRIAFWTDDESAKININTASEGLYWDVPRTTGKADGLLFANRQPVRGEFNRYPGHPATVSLSAVLDPWTGPGLLNQTNLPDTPNSSQLARMRLYHALTPRITSGGSDGGLRTLIPTTIPPATQPVPFPPLLPDADRLYATVDELLLLPDRTFQPTSSPFSRTMLDQVKFFLTAHSRAPEVNLHGKPRIALWPLQTQADDRNVLDRLIAFCSSTGSPARGVRPFHFQRHSTHQKGSTNSSIGHGSSQSPSLDWQQITRNRQLYSLLQRSFSAPVPGFGGSFAAKYSTEIAGLKESDQILTQMLDFLRSGVNTYAVGLPSGGPGVSSTYCYAPPRAVPGSYPSLAFGESQVIPLRVENGTQGFGRTVTITEAALVLYPVATLSGATHTTAALPDLKVSVPGMANRRAFAASQMRAFLMLEFFSAMPGTPSTSPYLAVDVQAALSVNGTLLDFPKNATSPELGLVSRVILHSPIGWIPGAGNNNTGAGHSTAHYALFQPLFEGGNSGSGDVRKRDITSTDPWTGFAWNSSNSIPVPPPGPGLAPVTMPFAGGPLTISIRAMHNGVAGELVQTLYLQFPPATLPSPYAYIHGTSYLTDPTMKTRLHRGELSLQARIGKARSGAGNSVDERNLQQYPATLIRPGDVVRSLEFSGQAMPAGSTTSLPQGDFRLIAARAVVDTRPGAAQEGWFIKGGAAGDYENPTRRLIHGLRHGNNWQYAGQLACLDAQENGDDVTGIHSNTGRNTGDFSHPFWPASSYRISGSLVQGIGGPPLDSTDTVNLYRDAAFVCARGTDYARRHDGRPGDWDNGFGNNEDGCYINKPDEDNAAHKVRATWAPNEDAGGYYSRGAGAADLTGQNNAPNRQIASAVQFGSLPSGLIGGRSWQTLLFCPNPAGRLTPANAAPTESDHPGFALPRDHLLLDLFWMPVVEPYAISEPFSTAGKINMNYDIMPFRYIKRRTGMHALLRRMGLSAIHARAASVAGARPPGINEACYKGGRNQIPFQTRYDIDPDATTGTLSAFERRFNLENDLFRSASEICEVFLVPKMCQSPAVPYPSEATARAQLMKYADLVQWWNGQPAQADAFELTGDNSREAPYGQLYPRLTTKSNVYQVHYRVQTLQKARSTDPALWDEAKDRSAGEKRGSAILERYLDPADAALPDLADVENFTAAGHHLDRYYRYRIIQRRDFAP